MSFFRPFATLTRRYVHTASYRRSPATRFLWGTAAVALVASTSFALSRNTIRLDADIEPFIESATDDQEFLSMFLYSVQ